MPKPFSDREAIEMMERCISELGSLRAQIDQLRPKADAYDNIATILGLLQKPSQSYGESLTWVLRKRIQELQPQPVNEVP
jgi:hypothetical protein